MNHEEMGECDDADDDKCEVNNLIYTVSSMLTAEEMLVEGFIIMHNDVITYVRTLPSK